MMPPPGPGMMPPPGPGMMPPPGVITCNPDQDADALRAAMKGLGTRDSDLVRILGSRNYAERMAISAAFTARHGRNLKADLHSETSGNYRKLLEMLVTPRPNVIAQAIFDACNGLGTDDFHLLTLVSQFDQDMPMVASAFQAMFKKDLVSTIKSETSGHYEDVLVALVTRQPPPYGYVNAATVQADAQAFYKAGEGRLGTNDHEYIRILTSNSNAHLLAVDQAYRTMSKRDMLSAIDSETSGNYRKTLKSLMTPHHRWMAQVVKWAIEGLGTDDDFIRIVFALHDKQDLQLIAQEYRTLYGKDMITEVKKDISGNYERLCVARMG